MTYNTTNHSLPYALLGSALGGILISFAGVWLATSLLYPPVIANTHSSHSPSGPMYQLSPIPPGADWTT